MANSKKQINYKYKIQKIKTFVPSFFRSIVPSFFRSFVPSSKPEIRRTTQHNRQPQSEIINQQSSIINHQSAINNYK